MAQQFDYIVIGGGSGGLATARRAALYGQKVLLVEKSLLGGTCVNVGCVPKKMMWYGANIVDEMHMASQYGITVKGYEINFQELKLRRDRHIDGLNRAYIQHLSNEHVNFISGEARFIDQNTIQVGQQAFQARYITIATGSKPKELQIPGGEFAKDSDYFFHMEQLPQNVSIIGSGYIAVELAGILQMFSAKVTLISKYPTLLSNFDWEITQELQRIYSDHGIDIIYGAQVSQIEQFGKTYVTTIQNRGKITSDLVFSVIGREGNIDHLDLARIGLEILPSNFIRTNEFDQTNHPHIFAVGDVTGKNLLTPVAIQQGRRLSERLFNNKSQLMQYQSIPTVIFSHPPIGAIGYSEDQARSIFQNRIRVYKTRFNSLYYGVSDYKQQTVLKLVCLDEEEKVIGLHGIGKGMDEIVQGFAVAMVMGATRQDFHNTVPVHPTSAEDFVLL